MATIKKITGNYTILASDKGKHLIVDSPNDVTIVVPATTASLESEILVRRYGKGRVFFVSDSTSNIRSARNEWEISDIFSAVVLIKISAREWTLDGDKK